MSFDENITVRKRQDKRMNKTNSDLGLEEDYETTSEEALSAISLQNLSSEDIPLVMELENEIKNLKLQLQIANNEIDNLNEENFNLKKQITANEKKMRLLKTKRISELNFSNSSTPIQSKEKQSDVQRQSKISTPMKKLSYNTENKYQENVKNMKNSTISKIETANVSTNKYIESESKHQPEKMSQKRSNVQNDIKNKRNIFILGDNMVKGLATKLISSRNNTWNDLYKISALVKPQASTEEIFSYYYKGLKNKFTPNDKIILSFGSNDQNPYKILSQLSVILYKLRRFKVCIIPVLYNPYINTGLLNDLIYSICKNYDNCHFMSRYIQEHTYSVSKKYVLRSITNNINNWVDMEDYHSTYINLNYLNKKNNNTETENKISNNNLNKNFNVKRGTIPFYFKQQKENKKLEIKPPRKTDVNNNTLNSNLPPKKGTIPFYFQRVLNTSKTFFRSHK